jgi:hypothetical protein
VRGFVANVLVLVNGKEVNAISRGRLVECGRLPQPATALDLFEAGQWRLLDVAAAKYGPARLMMVWYGLRERMRAAEVYELLGIEVFKRLTASEGATKKSPAESSAGVSTTTKKRVLDSSAPFDGSTRPPPVGLSD